MDLSLALPVGFHSSTQLLLTIWSLEWNNLKLELHYFTITCNGPVANPAGRVEGRGEKHEIYAAAFVGHLFYDLFLQGQRGHGPLRPPGSATMHRQCRQLQF